MTRKIRFAFIAVIAALTLVATPLVSASEMYPEPQRTISTSGMGIVTAEPDIAKFSVGLEARNEDLKPAQDEVTGESVAITEMLREAGIEDKDIQTTSYQVTPVETYDRNGNFDGIESYVVRMSISVTVRDLDLVGELLDEAVTLGADYVSSIQFSVADPTPYIQEARQAAIADAKLKAEDYAAGSDSRITGLFSLYESSSPRPLARESGGMEEMDGAPMAADASMESNPVEISAGSTTFMVQIETTWTIEPAGVIEPEATPAS